jgi:hypothetical protein
VLKRIVEKGLINDRRLPLNQNQKISKNVNPGKIFSVVQ